MNVKELLDKYYYAKGAEARAEYIDDGSSRQREIDTARAEQDRIIKEITERQRSAESRKAALIAELVEALENPTPEMIATAWVVFKGQRQLPIGAGPAFVEAFKAGNRALLAKVKP